MVNFGLIVFFATTLTVWAQIDLCPRVCRCDRRKIAYCNERQLDYIPYGIPGDTETLLLQINNISNGVTTNEILRNLMHLTKLDLHRNKLTSVPTGLPSSLKYIDLRRNDLKYVGKTSLSGLTALTELHLDGNNITNFGLVSTAFADLRSLNILVFSDNLLTEFPESLPESLQILRLENNLIRVIKATATFYLRNLINLDLSRNMIAQTAIEPGALTSLRSLRVLDMSRNHLTQIPRDLPENLEELMLSNNKIEFIFNSDNRDHGSLSKLKSLHRVDFSSNHIKSIQISSFAYLSLDSVALQDNPWQCDCHLQYFKQWLRKDGSTLSSESNIRCHSPSAFSGVTLNSIDEEALECESRLEARNRMKIIDVTASDFVLLWRGSEDTPDPPFVKRLLMYGPLGCNNCSIDKLLQTVGWQNEIAKHLEKYSSQDITFAVQQNPLNARVKVNRLLPDTHYAVCVFDSEQNDNDVSLNQCLDLWTSTAVSTTPSIQDNVVFLPLWLIVLSCVVVFVLLIAIVGGIAWRRRNSLKSKTPRTYLTNRPENDIFFHQHQGTTRYPPVGYREIALGYGTNMTSMTDRTYAECGPASTASRTLRDSAIDARMEFDVLIKPDETTAPKRVNTPMSTIGRWVKVFVSLIA